MERTSGLLVWKFSRELRLLTRPAHSRTTDYDRGRYGIFPNRKMLVQHPATVTINVDRSSSFSMCAASGAPPEVSKWSAGAIFAPPRIEPRMQIPLKELWLALHARRLRPINRYNGMLRTRNSPSHMAADFILGREPNRKIKPIIRKEVAVAPRTPVIIPSDLLLLDIIHYPTNGVSFESTLYDLKESWATFGPE
jgi:hypothetical protein